MKKLIQKYLEMGCYFCIYISNGDEIKNSQYTNIELFDDCFTYSHIDENYTIYPYSSILKICVDSKIPF